MGRKNEVIDSMSEAELEQAKSTKIIKWWPGCSQVAKQKHLERVDARLAEITEQHAAAEQAAEQAEREQRERERERDRSGDDGC